jgi:hypothetical protein
METFSRARGFVRHPDFEKERVKSLVSLDAELRNGMIDPPLVPLLEGFSKIPYCFTIQSCYGHFIHEQQLDEHNLLPLAGYAGDIQRVKYRIAYLALCIRETGPGRELYCDLERITRIDPGYIQFGSPDWFWERHVNSFALQVEPGRFITKDSVELSFDEALHVEKIRDIFFDELFRIMTRHVPGTAPVRKSE